MTLARFLSTFGGTLLDATQTADSRTFTDDEMARLERRRFSVTQKVTACRACVLSRHARAPVPLRGPLTPTFAVLGEAPGQTEDRAGKPFVGRAGKLLDEMMDEAGIDVSGVAYVNTVSCYPFGPPEEYATKACRGNMKAQLDSLPTPFLLLLGRFALEAFRPDLRITGAINGAVFWQGERVLMPLYHPAYVLRNPGARGKVVLGLMRWKRVVEGELAPSHALGERCVRCRVEVAEWRDPEGIGYCVGHVKGRKKSPTELAEEHRRVVVRKVAKARVRARQKKQMELGL